MMTITVQNGGLIIAHCTRPIQLLGDSQGVSVLVESVALALVSSLSAWPASVLCDRSSYRAYLHTCIGCLYQQLCGHPLAAADDACVLVAHSQRN